MFGIVEQQYQYFVSTRFVYDYLTVLDTARPTKVDTDHLKLIKSMTMELDSACLNNTNSFCQF